MGTSVNQNAPQRLDVDVDAVDERVIVFEEIRAVRVKRGRRVHESTQPRARRGRSLSLVARVVAAAGRERVRS
jgi:hypothetical protein